jgi:hydroxypyruvate reductase
LSLDIDLSEHRKNLLAVFNSALKAVQGRHVVASWLTQNPLSANVHVIAIGKAAQSMYDGASEVLGTQLQRGLIITRQGYAARSQPAHTSCIESSHPVPSERSLEAGQALLDFIAQTPDDAEFLFLISGGASALVEVLPAGMDIHDLMRMNEWLLASGMDISRMNRVRRAYSSIKGGRLAIRLGQRKTRCLLISDVLGDDPATIGSGLLVASKESFLGLADIQLPGWLATYDGLATEPPLPADACFRNITVAVIARVHDAMQAAATAATALGYDVYLHHDLFCCDAESTGLRLAQQLLDGNSQLHIWGGETVVLLPAEPGRGGRNQQLALSAASLLDGHEGCYLLAAGTDGSDGATGDAGALVDAATVVCGRGEGFSVDDCLRRADAGSLLQASGDLITTGVTGTNVMDMVLGLKGG